MISDNIQIWATGVGVTLLSGLILRIAKKNKWAEKIQDAGIAIGKALSKLLLGWLPPAKAEAAEEGIIVTVLNWGANFLRGIELGMLSDNTSKLQEKVRKK